MAAVQHGDGGGRGVLLGAHALQVAGEGLGAGRLLAFGQPVLHQGVFGDAGVGGDGRGQGALQGVADGLHTGGQGFIQQEAFGQAVHQHRVDADDDQDAGEQGRAHAEDQLPLNTALPEAHGVVSLDSC
ncbi:hypothetical protein D3C72_1980230 [compost metagenome]